MNENTEKIIPSDSTDKQVSSKSKKISKIILFSATALLVAAIILSLILILPLFTKNPVKNTFEILFFDTDVLSETMSSLNASGYENSTTLCIPSEITELNQDINLKISERGIGSGENQKKTINVKLDSEQNGYEFDIAYDNKNLALQGLSFDKDVIITFPRRNITDALDKSIFAHKSKSKYALKKDEYNELCDLVENLDLNTQEKFSKELSELIESLTEKTEDVIRPKNTYGFAKNKFALCRTTEIKLSEDDLKELTDIVYSELGSYPTIKNYLYKIIEGNSETDVDLDAEFDKFKESLTGSQVTISYTVAGRTLVEFSVITVSKEEKKTITNDFHFTFNGKTKNPEFKIEYEVAEQGIKITERNRQVAEYKKVSNKTEVIIDFSLISSDIRERPGNDIRTVDEVYSAKLSYDKNTNEYSIEYSDSDDTENLSVNGKFEFDTADDSIYLSIDKIVENDSSLNSKKILEFSLKPDKLADKITVPEGTLFLSLKDDAFEEFIRKFNIIEFDRTITDIIGESLGIVYTIDESPLLNSSPIVSRAQTYASYYKRYISKGSYKSSIYIYDEEYDIVILFDYIKSERLIQINFSYELTPEIKSYYSKATVNGAGNIVV